MFFRLVLLIASVYSSSGLPRPQVQQQPQEAPGLVQHHQQQRQLLYVPQHEQRQQQQYAPDPQYDLGFLEPQFQQPPGYNFIGNRQHYPRVQPQIFLYHGGAAPGGQPFLLQPGGPQHPGNFLVPQQPGPNVLVRNTPQRPVFVAGYPKPAHIPPIEKDAEQIPTNPSKIPPLPSTTASTKGTEETKPEKLETFNEDEPKKQPSEGAPARNPFNTRTNLHPGQRFFILNGQPLFSNYPYNNQIYPLPNPNIRYAQPELQYGVPVQAVPTHQQQPTNKNNPVGNIPNFENFFIRNGVTGQIDDIAQNVDLISPQNYPENLILLNQPGNFRNGGEEALFRSVLPEHQQQLTKDIKFESSNNGKLQNDGLNSFELFQLNNDDEDNEAVIIDARYQDETPSTTTAENESETVNAPEKSAEPTISQAAPGAIALAGPGGVAAAAPRGTAFVGKDGVAVSSPQATAVAGPSKEEPTTQKNKKSKRKQ